MGDALRRRGHEVAVVGTGNVVRPGVVSLPTAIRFHATPIPRRIAPLRDVVASADIVHVTALRDPVGLVAATTARRRHIPYVIEPAGMHRRRVRSGRIKAAYD